MWRWMWFLCGYQRKTRAYSSSVKKGKKHKIRACASDECTDNFVEYRGYGLVKPAVVAKKRGYRRASDGEIAASCGGGGCGA